jgi:hypothetical protein
MKRASLAAGKRNKLNQVIRLQAQDPSGDKRLSKNPAKSLCGA